MNTDLQNAQTRSWPEGHGQVFILVFVMLVALTGLTFWIANSHLMEHRMLGWAAMIGVSVSKALLVILFFMQLWWERAWKYVVTIPALVMAALLVVLLIPDVGMRTETYSLERQRKAPFAELLDFRLDH